MRMRGRARALFPIFFFAFVSIRNIGLRGGGGRERGRKKIFKEDEFFFLMSEKGNRLKKEVHLTELPKLYTRMNKCVRVRACVRESVVEKASI